MNVLILGFGVSGKYIYDYLLTKSYNIYIVDDNYNLDDYEVFKSDDFLKLNVDLSFIVKSPGIKYDHVILNNYSDVTINNDIELFYEEVKNSNVKIIGITGTNGKTSTVTLLNAVLNKSGFNSKVAGNIGVSPLKYVNDNLDYIVMELSSFQLKQINNFTTYAAFFLNFTPDHLDYHEDLDDYYNSKLNIIKNCPVSSNLYTTLNIKSDNVNVIHNKAIDIDYSIINMSLNPSNVELIYKFLKCENIDTKFLFEVLRSDDMIIEHRIEYVDSVNGVKFYNDSKATNVSASSLALQRLSNIILLVGGYDKKEDMTVLKSYLSNVKFVVAYGSNKKEFSFITNVKYCSDLNDAFKCAVDNSKEGDTILLSPCSASYDQYKNYEERGRHFKSLVESFRKEFDEVYY